MIHPSPTDVVDVVKLEYNLPVYKIIKGCYGIDVPGLLIRSDSLSAEIQWLKETVADQTTLIQRLLAHKQVKLPKKRNT